MKTWITADHHFGHANILKYCSRPFEIISEHDAALTDAWNSCVGVNDLVYHLGDFTLTSYAGEYFSKLSGNIRILGYPWHHDSRWIESVVGIYDVPDVELVAPMIVIEDVIKNKDGRGVPLTLCHYPLEVWDRSHYGGMHVHGHSHGVLPNKPGRIDVGVDAAYKLTGKYRPLLLGECIEFIQSNLENENA